MAIWPTEKKDEKTPTALFVNTNCRKFEQFREEKHNLNVSKLSWGTIGVHLHDLEKWRNCTTTTKWQIVRWPCTSVGLRASSICCGCYKSWKLVMGVARRQHRTRPSSLPPELGRGHSLRCINKTFQSLSVNNYQCLIKKYRHHNTSQASELARVVIRFKC